MKNKIIAFDFLRALAILMIIPAHLSNFLFSTYSKLGLYAFDPYLANMGLGLFIFMSGYLLYYHNNSIDSFKDIISFYKKRLLRIFPLYWAALATFTIVFFVFAPKLNSGFVFPNAENVFSFSNILMHALGLQILLAPAYVSPMLTLYFIGLIIIFYIIYPFIIMLSKDSKGLLIISSIIFLGTLLLSKTLNIIEHRFFMFFPVFILGILTCKEDVFEKSWTTLREVSSVKLLLAALPVMFVMVIVLGSRMVLLLDPKVSMTIETPGGTIRSSMLVSMLGSFASLLGLSYTALKFMLDTLLLNIFAIVFSVFEYKLAIKLIDDKFSGSLSSTFTYIATSSYCVYLFHRPFLALWNAGTNFISSPILRDITVFFVALPLLFFICYHIQIFEWSSKQHFSHKKTSDKNLPFKILVTSFLNNQMEHLRSRKV
jgi:peptidoglycan/LPS O-acetylase OafA/YrhL